MEYRHDKPFRLLQHYDIDGALTLSLDAVLQKPIREDWTTQPVIRLHSFANRVITVGHDKRAIYDYLRMDKMVEDGVQLISRTSSGTAVLLHNTELCLSFMTHPRQWDNYSIKGMFLEINKIMAAAMQEIGVETILAERGQHGPRYNCFASIDPDEVCTVTGRKLVGGGLLARSSIYFHHAVVPITPAYREVDQYIDGDVEYESPPTSILEEIGSTYDIPKLGAIIAGHFSDFLPIELGDVTGDEVADARKLLGTIYADKARQWQA